MKYNRISADCHLDLCCLPPDLFVSEASSEFKTRVPHVLDGPDGPYWIDGEGTGFGLVNGVSAMGAKYVKGYHHRDDMMAATGLYGWPEGNPPRRRSAPQDQGNGAGWCRC